MSGEERWSRAQGPLDARRKTHPRRARSGGRAQGAGGGSGPGRGPDRWVGCLAWREEEGKPRPWGCLDPGARDRYATFVLKWTAAACGVLKDNRRPWGCPL